METQQQVIEEEVIEESQQMPEILVEQLSDTRIEGGKPDLNGVEVGISGVTLIPKDDERKSQDGRHVYRPVLLRVAYDNGSFEFFGGLKQFQHQGAFGAPTFFSGGRSAIADLYRVWQAKTGNKPSDASLKKFLQSLIGMRGILKSEVVVYQGKEFRKNVIAKFL